MGLLSVGGILQKNNISCYMVDAFLQRLEPEETAIKVLKEAPDIIGMSCLTPTYPDALKTAEEIKKINPTVPIVIGGYHATNMPKEIIQSDD